MTAGARVAIDVRWRDLDELGHLNQSVYHEFLEEGRSALLSSLAGAHRNPFVVARVELDYIAEVRRSDSPVEVVVRVARVGRSSVTLEHDILKADGTIAARGITIIVGWDSETRASRAITDDERAIFGG